MALRGGPTRRLPGNPLGGMLRDLDRRTRTTRRKPRPLGEPQPAEMLEDLQEPQGPPSALTHAVTIAVTGEDGRARWDFPAPFPTALVLTALPVDPEPGDDRTVTAALETVTEAYAVVRVWRTRPKRGQGVADPAGAGVLVHLTATALTGT